MNNEDDLISLIERHFPDSKTITAPSSCPLGQRPAGTMHGQRGGVAITPPPDTVTGVRGSRHRGTVTRTMSSPFAGYIAHQGVPGRLKRQVTVTSDLIDS
jgi:hypothetical protein